MSDVTCDVIIAGAGPVGLFLASELRLAKLAVLVLEQTEDPRSPLKRMTFGMRGLWGPSVEALHRRGLLEGMAAQPSEGAKGAGPRPGAPSGASGEEKRGPAGHFAGIPFDYVHIDPSRWPYRLPGPAEGQLGATMEHIEKVLGDHALAVGAEIRRGQGVESFEASEEDVIVRSRTSTAAPFIAPSRSRWSTCSRCCGGSRGRT